MADRGTRWAAWVTGLPSTVSELAGRWRLSPDGTPAHGHCSLVLPVRTVEGTAAALKVAFPDEESRHEHLALRRWNGDGAVRLLSADPHVPALLLERLERTDLTAIPDTEACRIVAGLYPRLHRPALPPLRSLSEMVGYRTGALRRLPRSTPIPRRLVEEAIGIGSDLAAGGDGAARLLHGDLHYANVLAAPQPADREPANRPMAVPREPWLAIDPKPLNGDPHYELAPMLWNRWAEIAGDVRAGVHRRLRILVETAGLDEERARAWVLVRMMHNAMWAVQDGPADKRDWLTICIALAKAARV